MSARPRLSVVVPAYQGEQVLRRSLPALLASELPKDQWELVVVDDGSTDATASVAAGYADAVIRLEGPPSGPAHARNRGVEASTGDIVAFVDADVCVHPDTLGGMLAAFDSDPGLAALFGSYDADPHAPGVVSQFRNLLHHHVHHDGAGPAETFWAGCGAVRREPLRAVGMMDAAMYPRPQIEDIELGRRLRRAGYRIALVPEIQCMHLKRWTLRNMVVTDFRDRGVPWMRLLLSEGSSAGSTALNLRAAERLCALLAGLGVASIVVAGLAGSVWPLVPGAAALATLALLHRRFYRLLLQRRGPALAAAALPLHVLYYLTAGTAAAVAMFGHFTAPVGNERVVRSGE